jgi:hypothetical protein
MLPTIVFVHLNSPVPFYLRLNIISTIKKFPNAKIVLIRNDKKSSGIHSDLWHFEYESGTRSLSIENSLSHPKDFRDNFWFSAIQRFDALRLYIERTNEPILHLESDVIISKDFPLEKFIMNKIKIAYPVVADNRGVASSVFIKDLEAARKLIRFADEACSVNSHTTDMEILAEFFQKNQDTTFSLAFGPKSAHAYKEGFSISRVLPSYKIFGGVFDGNDIGVFLFGTNPRNARGVSYVRTSNPGNYARINQWSFEYDNLRRFINLEFDGEVFPVYSVHATSKQVTLFYHFTQNFFIRRYLRINNDVVVRRIFPFITLAMGLRKILKLWKS